MTFAQIVNGTILPIFDKGIIPMLYALAFLFFLFGIARLFFAEGEESREKGKKFALWGVVGFVVLFSVWGLVKLLLGVIHAI
jgi:uncharacterized membrane protein YjfL (UPF0719 family)